MGNGYQIAVFGSGNPDTDKGLLKIAEEVGSNIAEKGHTLISGMAKGISVYAAKGAKDVGGNTVGISPSTNRMEMGNYNVSAKYIDTVIHTGMGDRGRNLISARACDGLIVINGSFGVLNEITVAVGENKPIVIIKNSGGVADIVKDIFKKLDPGYKWISYVNNHLDAVGKLEQLIEAQKLV